MSEHDPSSQFDDNPGVAVPPPVLFLATTVGGLIVDWISGASLGALLAGWFDYPGWILFFIGLGFMAVSILQFTAAGTNVRPDQPTFTLVTSGIYALSRNPIYVGMILCTFGLALALDAPVVIVLLIPAILILRYGVIAREEAYLERKFGTPYLAYKARVGRWFLGFGKDEDRPAGAA